MPLRYYRDQQAWRDLQERLPAGFQLTDADAPTEEYWSWRGHQVHLDRYRDPDAPARILLHHGVGTNGRQLSLILGAPLAGQGLDVIALDNLGYGLTRPSPGSNPTYADWVDLVTDFIAHEQATDSRPLFLLGLSAGGMLAYHVAAQAPPGTLAGIIGLCFLDQRDLLVRDETAANLLVSRVGVPINRAAARTVLARMPVPMRLISKMTALTNDPEALRIFLADRTSAGNTVSLGFLNSYMTYPPACEPEDFAGCPVLLTQPAQDRWTPMYLSRPFLDRITRVPVITTVLDDAGHYPLERPGLTQLHQAITGFVSDLVPGTAAAADHRRVCRPRPQRPR